MALAAIAVYFSIRSKNYKRTFSRGIHRPMNLTLIQASFEILRVLLNQGNNTGHRIIVKTFIIMKNIFKNVILYRREISSVETTS